ncbi:alpha/beta hydrolase [Actinokineospora bangkokensis]|uniref:Alpha/beta hydrolase n=1 Tax=Actinokineospora bangkokensis TaxID=1193682 RepID=A0A1Q9LLZ9_9PSEU|nr:alpha/beta fold hydrolase [Actinokineospora bangkokensis]OLR93023.1 alpha/beta hydrolase [Actinokineospora bangkokensis]
MQRTDVSFRSGDAECAAWLYRPDPLPAPGPVVVLGHGLGATREGGLDAYARRFAEAGLTAVVFDYRHFGASGGHPRQLLDIGRQVDDWHAAIAFARTVDGTDPHRVALWGTSFGGGHVIEVAARDRRVAAVVAQCPFTDGPASVRALGLRSLLKLTPAVLRDQLAALRGADPVRVPLVGPPGSAALMTAPDAEPGYRALFPPGVDFDDRVAGRIGLRIGLHRPGKHAARVRCPILFAVCDEDSVAPAGPTLRHAAAAPRGTVLRYPVGHFDVYRGEAFEAVVADQVAFLLEHLDAG